MRICVTLYGRTELAELNVVHIERIDEPDGRKHDELKAVCFLRPTRENIVLLKRELKSPRYSGYNLHFSNLLSSVSSMFLQELAEADAAEEKVAEVQEVYADFLVPDPHHFTVPVPRNELLFAVGRQPGAAPSTAEYELIDRCVQGLSAVFLALRRRPVIRYQRGSDLVVRLAESLYRLTYKQESVVFDFGASRSAPPVVLLLDRRDDPVTPLLTQWSYQAMVHELVGVVDNSVKLTSPKVPDQFREIVFDARQDDFLRRHIYKNYGEVGASVKSLVEQFQSASTAHSRVESLEDMRRFVLEHADFQKFQGNVSKHVNLMTQLSEVVSSRNLMEISMAEQELANPAASLTPAASFEELTRLLRAPGTKDVDKVRLAALYALRFESDAPRVRQLLDFLVTAGVRDREPRLYAAAESILRYGGASRRAGDLYGSRNLLVKARNVFKGLQGIDNVYTQHTPLLCETVAAIASDRLDPAAYPFMAATGDEAAALAANAKRAPPREVIIFIVGGTTYEEAKAVAEMNERANAAAASSAPPLGGGGGLGGLGGGGAPAPTPRVILGGTAILNSEAFMAALTTGLNIPPPAGAGGGGGAGLGGGAGVGNV
ncbi:VPS33 protein [Gonium pectorale]|uniref:VPS33 protein n=1 Tax=Gonium pectorale TaxID=33097 RepID=A0A150G2A9_GONPE|nr:VPS33 protein [Gonium pectorale]|eukprot:KXZ43440.1 VPS33 protein [Gonium pectorale]